jgi:murein DD-endopeptidase MepM/ murein hydrolase activator NlpD
MRCGARALVVSVVFYASPLYAQTDTTSHGWPVTPAFSTHEITGTFSEFRNTLSSDHFHNGIDIPKPDRSPVYSVLDGVVYSIGTVASEGNNAYIRVRYRVAGLDKSDAYVHMAPNPLLRVGDSVYAQQTVLGNILDGMGHVHFTHGYYNEEINGIRPLGGCTPYIDNYPPQIASVRFFIDESSVEFPYGRLSGPVDIRVHVRETNAAYPSQVRGSTSNNGTYIAGYRILSADTSTVVYEPPSAGVRFKFDSKPSNSYVHRVFSPGSDLSTHIYTMTNGGGADEINSTGYVAPGYWDTGALSPGTYVVMIWAIDTRALGDTVYLPVQVQEGDPVPPAAPVLRAVENDSTNRVTVSWYANTEPDLLGYRLYFTLDEKNWVRREDENVLGPATTSISYENITSGTVFFRLTAIDSASPPNESVASDVYGMRLNTSSTGTLLVDGFDRREASGSYHLESHPFAMTHGFPVPLDFNTCANDAVIDGSVDLNGYDVVVWILGDESANDETFSSAEQALVRAYMDGGGHLFVTGSEIAYDLDRASGPTAADRAFLHDYLKVSYAGDDSGIYSVVGTTGSWFQPLSLRYGITSEGSPYEEDWPDEFTQVNGSEVIFLYETQTGNSAGAAYKGPAPNGSVPGGVVVMGFPFETITTEGAQDQLMDLVFSYFGITTGVADEVPAGQVPARFALEQNYPNPFNPTTVIQYAVPRTSHVRIVLFDLLGREVGTLLDGIQNPGHHRVRWDATGMASGVYYYRLTSGDWSQTKSMMVIK